MERAYQEAIDFIAAGTTPEHLIAVRPSEAAKARVLELVERRKGGTLSPDEASELEHYLQLEHLMRLANAQARSHVAS